MTLLYLYSQDGYNPVIKHYIKCLVDEDFFPSNIILVSNDNSLKKQIIKQLSKLTQIDILTENKPFTKFNQSKLSVVNDKFMIKYKYQIWSDKLLNKEYRKIGKTTERCFGYNIIVLSESLNFIHQTKNKQLPYYYINDPSNYCAVILQKAKSYYIKQFKS